MNLSELIKDKIEAIQKIRSLRDLYFISDHIERAQILLIQGRNDGDSEKFTESILRNNLAFEAILREAYLLYKGESSGKMPLAQIEDYFLKNPILSNKIMNELKRYREQWRNESTHAYSAKYDEHDAFFSVISLLGFAHIFLSEMLRKLAYDIEKQEYLYDKELEQKIKEQSLFEAIIHSLIKWTSNISNQQFLNLSEAELIGRIEAFLHSSIPRVSFFDEKRPLADNLHFDLVAYRGSEIVVLEIKQGHYVNIYDRAIIQLDRMLEFVDGASGICFIYNHKFKDDYAYDTVSRKYKRGSSEIAILHPSSMDPG
ncbi:hypothetical protein AB3N59_19640 [Leptospira sp. WS92.C1]